MDKSARADQLARCVAHTGDAFLFAPGDLAAPVEWFANSATESAPGEGKNNRLVATGRLALTGPRSAFAPPAREPREGDDLTDALGTLYTVAFVPPQPLNPLLVLLCTVSPSRSAT